MIDIQGLEVSKSGRTICSVPQLAVGTGERVAVIGKNGSGKSTLLRVLAGFERDWQGRCEVQASWRERTYVHQNPYLFRGTVLASVAYGLRSRGQPRAAAESTALRCLGRLGIQQLAASLTHQLSGGETRRVALARAVVLKPRLLLLDEPLAELDAEGIELTCSLLAELPETTMVIASPAHLPSELDAREFRLDAPQDD